MKRKKSLSEEIITEIAEFYLALSEPARIKIIQKIIENGPGTVNEITERCAMSQSSTSKHLKILHKAGLLAKAKDESKALYALHLDTAPLLCNLAIEKIAERKQQGLPFIIAQKNIEPTEKASKKSSQLKAKVNIKKQPKATPVKKRSHEEKTPISKKTKAQIKQLDEDSNQLLMF